MATLARFYIDKTQDSDSPGSHSRILDTAELDPELGREKIEALLEADEEINSVVSISVDYPDEYEVVE